MHTTNNHIALHTSLIRLFQMRVEWEYKEVMWNAIVNMRSEMQSRLSAVGLELVIDEAGGQAYLEGCGSEEDRKELSWPVSHANMSVCSLLLLSELNKELSQNYVINGDSRLIISDLYIMNLMSAFWPPVRDDKEIMQEIRRSVRRMTELGFLRLILRNLESEDEEYEVQPIVGPFFDALWWV